jgi:hypothetical protein
MMAYAFISETVNIVDNNFSADSRDKDGKRVVMFDNRRTLQIYLSPAHILQIESVVDSKDAVERGVISMTSGIRYITARAAATICGDIAKMVS